jgi:hypothetical protein
MVKSTVMIIVKVWLTYILFRDVVSTAETVTIVGLNILSLVG